MFKNTFDQAVMTPARALSKDNKFIVLSCDLEGKSILEILQVSIVDHLVVISLSVQSTILLGTASKAAYMA